MLLSGRMPTILSSFAVASYFAEHSLAWQKGGRGSNMDVAYISALSALAGSVIGGMTSGITTWLNQRSQLRSNQIAHDLSRREELYKEFILAASNAYGEAVMTNEPRIPDIIALYAMVSRMRAFSLPRTVACAEQVMLTTIETYALPNKSIPELSELMKDGQQSRSSPWYWHGEWRSSGTCRHLPAGTTISRGSQDRGTVHHPAAHLTFRTNVPATVGGEPRPAGAGEWLLSGSAALPGDLVGRGAVPVG
jgi:hypothetical protein